MRMNRLLQLILGGSSLLLSSCATGLDKPPLTPTPTTPEYTIRPVLQPSPRAELMYQVLAAELAGKRDQPDTALEHYRQLAASSDDPRLIERAAMLALLLKSEVSLELAQRWQQLAPKHPAARQALTLALLRQGQFDAAKPHLEAVRQAARDKDQQGGFATVASLLSQVDDKPTALRLMQDFSQRYPRSAPASYYLAMLAITANDRPLALRSLEQSLKLKPKQAAAHLLRARLLVEMGDQKAALAGLARAVAILPQERTLRMDYARFLVEADQLGQARRQFAILLKQNPKDTDSLFALGALASETRQFDLAEGYFQDLIKRNTRLPEAFFELGRIEEQRGEYAKARDWYQRVSGERTLIARLRQGIVLAKGGEEQALSDHFTSLRREQPQDSVMLYLGEAEAWSEAKRHQQAFDTLSQGLKVHPDDKQLLYARALAAEKLDRLDLLEQDLRAILAADPKNGQALNALGYTLADRTDRLTEALGYIEQALALLPEEAAVLDSMGWVNYRLGQSEQALDYLRRAYAAHPDAEIAAHLIEVLWETGQRDEAKRLWRTVSTKHPDNPFLLKLKPKLGQ